MRILIISLFVSAVCFGQGIKTNNQSGGTNTLVQNGHEFTIDTTRKPNIKSTSGKLSSADSLLIPVFSTKEVYDYLNRINRAAAALLTLRGISKSDYERLADELDRIAMEMDKKRKGIK